MSFNQTPSVRKQIRNLLFVLFAGVAFALMAILFALYNYNPVGNYYVKNSLISPEVISTLSRMGEKDRQSKLFFEKIEYAHQDFESKKWTTMPLDPATYSRFYQTISDDKSMDQVPDEVKASFNELPLSTLTITLDGAEKILQEVQFLYKGDFYRIQIRESKNQAEWIYFYHPHIYNKAYSLFIESGKK